MNAMKQQGFTVVEIIILVVVLSAIGLIGFQQYQSLEAAHRDRDRKTAINAMYYSLEEAYYPANETYPRLIGASTLPSVDPALFRDPSGLSVGEAGSDYQYEASGCNGSDQCEGFIIRSSLERESDYLRISRNTP